MTTKETFSYIDGDGSLVSYHDPYASVTPDQIARAEQAEQAIFDAKSDIEMGFTKLAFLLDTVDKERLYLARGFDSMKAYVESPEIKIKWRLAHDLIRIQREVLPMLEARTEQPLAALAQAGVSNVRAMLPLLRDDGGEEKFVELIEQAPSMTWNGVRQEVKKLRGQEAPIDQPGLVMFKLKIRKRETTSSVEMTGSDGVDIQRLGVFTVPNKWLPRLEGLFHGYVEYLDG